MCWVAQSHPAGFGISWGMTPEVYRWAELHQDPNWFKKSEAKITGQQGEEVHKHFKYCHHDGNMQYHIHFVPKCWKSPFCSDSQWACFWSGYVSERGAAGKTIQHFCMWPKSVAFQWKKNKIPKTLNENPTFNSSLLFNWQGHVTKINPAGIFQLLCEHPPTRLRTTAFLCQQLLLLLVASPGDQLREGTWNHTKYLQAPVPLLPARCRPNVQQHSALRQVEPGACRSWFV